MSSRVACDNGTRAAPNMPCSTRNTTIWPSDCAAPQSIEAMVKPRMQPTYRGLRPIARRQPADRRGHDRRRGDVGGQDPGDFVEARGETALHVGQRHVGDGLVEQLQHRGADRARGDHRPMGRIVVDGFSRHVGDLVVVPSSAGREDADKGRPPSNVSGARRRYAALTLLRMSFPCKREPRCRHTVMPALCARFQGHDGLQATEAAATSRPGYAMIAAR